MKRKTNVKNFMLLITRQVDFDSSAKGVCEAFIPQQTWSCPKLHKEKNILFKSDEHKNWSAYALFPLLNISFTRKSSYLYTVICNNIFILLTSEDTAPMQ